MDPSTNDDAEEIYQEPRGWLGVSLLSWSIILSCLLHTSFLVPSFLQLPRGDADLDLEWLKSFDHLEGLGHGSDGRWAEVDASSFRTRQEKVEPEVAPEPEPEPEVAPVPEPEPPKPEPRVEPRPKPQPRPATNTEVRAEVRPPAKPRTPQEVFSEGELPGLDRAGPNGLPAMEGYGPGNATFTALVRFDRIQGSEFEEPVRKLIAAVPDYRILLDGTGVDPVRDFDSMFMASSNPMYIEETFLAVRHRASQKAMQQRLDRRFEQRIAWKTHQNFVTRELLPDGSDYEDPRQILLTADELALLIRPEWLRQLTTELPDGSSMMTGVDAAALDRRPTMLDGLAHIERAADENTIVLISAMGARVGVPGIGRLTFEGAKLQVQNIERPQLNIDLALKSEDEATRFAAGCGQLKAKILDRVPWIAKNITKMVIDRLTCQAAGNYVAISGTYSREEAQRLLNIALPFVPRPAELAKLPKPKNPMADPGHSLEEPLVPKVLPAPTAAAAPDMGSDEREERDGGHQQQD